MSRQARLGLIVLAGVMFFVAALFFLATRQSLLTSTYTVRSEFNRVAGLLPGATVFYNGIAVGRVERVQLPDQPGGRITVVMQVRDEARHLIREDSRAAIQTDGLVGEVIVAISAGTSAQPVVEEGGRVVGVDPLDLSQFSDRALTSVARFDSVTITLTNMMQDVQSGEGSLGRFLYDDQLYEESVLTTAQARASLVALLGRADALTAIAAEASLGVNDIIARVNTGDGSLARFLREDSIYTALLTASSEFSTLSTDLRSITERFEAAAGWAAVGSFRFSENMEALKHNFLFRRYFEDRGYYELAPFEVRERALEETFRDLQERERELYDEAERLERLRSDLEGTGVRVAPVEGGGGPE